MFYSKSFIVSDLTFRALINFEFNVNPQEMDKEDVVHICSGILVIKRNEFGSFIEMWMDLESVI